MKKLSSLFWEGMALLLGTLRVFWLACRYSLVVLGVMTNYVWKVLRAVGRKLRRFCILFFTRAGLKQGVLRVTLASTIVTGSLLATSCTTSTPTRPDRVCEIFAEKGSWYKAARKAQKKWGTPVHVAMAFVHRESSFVADAKPPRKKLLGIVPWKRLSSAYGYAQATDEAWEDYAKETDRWFIDRDNFADAMDFIGWYNHRSHKRLGIPKTDAYRLYLAYYTGPSGYKRGVWKSSPTIQGYAKKVRAQANLYAAQIKRC